MNPLVIRENLKKHKGSRVLVQIYGMRNKKDKFVGLLKDIYPQIFTIEVDNSIRSFSYSDLIYGEVVLSFI
ncbi:MAG TPA: hypothetical protein DCY94_04545 [Firmicutes bacterium]|nr:hypothetical protein [Bacillota bacterium]